MTARRAALAVLLSLVLAAGATLLASWTLPLAAVHAGGTRWDPLGWGVDPAAPSTEYLWADEVPAAGIPHAGRYFRLAHPLIESIDFRRIIFVGEVHDLPFYRKHPPPHWAATLSIDMREGYEQVITTATGWPWRCFRSEQRINWRPAPQPPPLLALPPLSPSPPNGPAQHTPPAYHFKHHGGLDGFIPLQPIWPALAADTALFAAAWCILLFIPPHVRRLARRARGRCGRCGYDVRGQYAAGCPECGWGRAGGHPNASAVSDS
jgi:hypothetical protein